MWVNLFDYYRCTKYYDQFGLGTPIPIHNLADEFDGSLALIWADATSGNDVPSPDDIMSRITANFTSSQLKAVKKVASPSDVVPACPQNFALVSECFAAVIFQNIPANGSGENVEYTIQADAGLFYVNVIRHTSDFEERILPLQWALDQVSCLALCTIF
jgi:ATP-binding cassette, subfamily A (ABC1), member 3